MIPDDFLSHLDTADAGDVPALCLVYADWLDERGEPSEGWRALGVLNRVPLGFEPSGNYSWFTDAYEPDVSAFVLPDDWWCEFPAMFFRTRSASLTAAAEAFVRLPEETKREILGQVEHSLRG